MKIDRQNKAGSVYEEKGAHSIMQKQNQSNLDILDILKRVKYSQLYAYK